LKIDIFSRGFATGVTSAGMLVTTAVLPFMTYFLWQITALPEAEARALATGWIGSSGGPFLPMLGLPVGLMLIGQHLEMQGAIRRRRRAREKYLAARAGDIPWKPFG
jgi:hypothetical protein